MGDLSYDADESALARQGKAELLELMRFQQKSASGVMSAQELAEHIKLLKSRYDANRAKPVGATCSCACCGKSFVKKTVNSTFCSVKKVGKSSCKDTYWNTVNDKRRARAIFWKEVRGL